MVGVYDIKGKKVSTINLPPVFNTDIRTDLIKKAVVAIQSHRLQPYGPDWLSGKRTSAFSFGPGHSLSRIPRVTGGGPARGRGAIVPQAVGGRRAHPPVPEKVLKKRINKKEKTLATASAIASTAERGLVESRGHIVEGVPELPLIVTDELEELKRTKDVKEAFSKLGLDGELSRASKKTIRSGKGKKRGRKYKKKKSLLVVVSKDGGIKKAAENLLGVDVTAAMKLNAEDLAPGASPARLTIYTVSALKDLEKRFA